MLHHACIKFCLAREGIVGNSRVGRACVGMGLGWGGVRKGREHGIERNIESRPIAAALRHIGKMLYADSCAARNENERSISR